MFGFLPLRLPILAVDDFGLVQMHFQMALCQPCLKRRLDSLHILLSPAVNQSIVCIPAPGTVRVHRELILNYFRARRQFSSGNVEGLNNNAKVTMRKAYGFRTFRATVIALYHALGKLAEPPFTHTFF
jgi:Transposase